MEAGRAHDLDQTLQVGEAWGGAVAADLEQPLVVGPGDPFEHDDVVLAKLTSYERVKDTT